MSMFNVEDLRALGINIISGVLVEQFFAAKGAAGLAADQHDLERELQAFLELHNINVKAATVIDIYAQKGDISIQGTRLFAPESISMQSAPDTQVVFGNNSVSETSNSSIVAGLGATIHASGGASIRQDLDGSISFFA